MSDVTGTIERAPNLEQLRAIEEPGIVFVSAGAGTGKTTVIVERFCRAVCERGLDVDSILVITYTERAAGELRGRIRRRLAELGRHDLARELDAAWISTIHGFCRRLLKAHPFAAGIDPRFRILDESQGRVLRGEAFRSALEEFCGEDTERLRLLASYGGHRLRRMLTGVHETLRSSGLPLRLEAPGDPRLDERLEELRAAAATLEQGEALRFLEASPATETLLDLSDLRVRGGEAEAYEEARHAVEQAALEALAARDREQLQELLMTYDRAYREAKDRESALDFEDLQLLARVLLQEHAEIRERESWRFRSVMVDEFQDTNRLQCELVDLLASEDGELFFVGDEFQSIYRFRHADVEVFRERREQAGGVLALTQNYRSRPEVLDVINHLFAADFGETFRPLAAAGRFPDPAFGPAVELLVTDKDSYKDTGMHWRSAEARHIAQRVRGLVDAGEATPGEIVLLFAAGTDARLYEEELRAAGLPTFRATGRDYYRQQQVVDLLAYLRLLHNRYDDEALVSVLASPFVGVSNDGLVLLRRAATRRPLFTGLEKGFPPSGLSSRDTRLFQAFKQRYERLAGQAPSLTLERLCEQIVCEHDYDLAVLAQWDGRRRYANLRKLGRLARSYEELRGPDVEGFVRFVAEQDAVGASELEAAAEEEGTDVIRLLTIHSAKGLEFKVVVVADAGRDRGRPDADEILCLPDGRLGFRVADPASGKRLSTADYESVKTAERDAEEAERRRLYYVAMTRAIDRLIVSGAIGEGGADAGTPIGWVLERLEASELGDAENGPVEIERDGARLLLRVDRYAEDPRDTHPAPAEQLELFAVSANGDAALEAPTLAPLTDVPAAPLHRARRLSYSALSLFDRCSYRYFAERVVGLRATESKLRTGETGLAATEIGDAVHMLLEHVDLRRPAAPVDGDELVRGRYPDVSEEELERIRVFVSAYCESELAARIAGLQGAAAERPFAFEHDGVLLHGRLDVLVRDPGSRRLIVVDYKTNWLEDADPTEIVERDYRLQRLIYALACFRSGAEEVEVVYQFLERPNDLVTVCYKVREVEALEVELSRAIAGIQAGEFRPTPSEFVCADCPALDLVCAGPRLHNA